MDTGLDGDVMLTKFDFRNSKNIAKGTLTAQPAKEGCAYLGWKLADGTVLNTDTFDFDLTNDVIISMDWKDLSVKNQVDQEEESPKPSVLPQQDNISSPATGDNTALLSAVLLSAGSAITMAMIAMRKKSFGSK